MLLFVWLVWPAPSLVAASRRLAVWRTLPLPRDPSSVASLFASLRMEEPAQVQRRMASYGPALAPPRSACLRKVLQ